MLKFKILLWLLTKLMRKAIKHDPACAKFVQGKNLVFQIRTQGGIGRCFTIANGSVSSVAGMSSSPQFTMTFRDAARGFAILSSKDSKDAFLTALHREDLAISGDFVEVMWFQGLSEYLQRSKK